MTDTLGQARAVPGTAPHADPPQSVGGVPSTRTAGAATGAGDVLTDWQRRVIGSEHGNMLSCVRCGQCLTSCPTYVLSMNEAESPRGRIALARAILEGQLAPTPSLLAHEQNCLVCDACTAVCPAGVHMDPLQVALRTGTEPNVRRGWRERMVRRVAFRYLFANMALFRAFVFVMWLYQRLGVQRLVRALGLVRLLAMERAEAFLPPVQRPFVVPKGEVYPAETSEREPAAGTPPGAAGVERVSFFAGCVMSTALADIDRATLRVLQRSGCDVVNTAGQGCCGALNAHSGDLEGAKELARRNIAAFERDGGSAVVVNSAGCGAMLKDYAHHFRADPAWAERAAAFSRRVKDVTEFLAGRSLPLRHSLEATVTYQEPCHLVHAQRIVQQPRALLRAIPGLELREMAESTLCCGSAGVYNLTNPVESTQLQQRKLDHAQATRAEMIVTANPGCLIQLRSGLAERGEGTPVKHIIELLDEATAP
ncbi:MAG: 4Fe-4S dicluster domain-containing protein [Chloroflexi bacterium]|nr:4Fe-4S dicluster domain-containing protein [Chloroflexota bacterium]